MLLVDTNVVFAALVANTPWSMDARTLFDVDSDWHTESYALVELTNILSRYVRVGEIDPDSAFALLAEAEDRFSPTLLIVHNEQALGHALRFRISGYDARFLAAASVLGVPLITEDAKLRRAAPALTRSIAEALAAK